MKLDDQLNDPAFFATGKHYALFDTLRVEDPVHWTQSPDGRGYWSVFRHADVKTVLNEPILFSSEREGVAPVVDAEMAAVVREAWGIGQNVATIDPPRHTGIRKVIAAPFLPKALTDGEARTKALIGEIFDQIPAHGEIDLSPISRSASRWRSSATSWNSPPKIGTTCWIGARWRSGGPTLNTSRALRPKLSAVAFA